MKTILAILTTSTLAFAADAVAVPGSEMTFVPKVQQYAHGKLVDLTITGTALRTKYTFKVYSMASYVQDGATVKTAEDLAKAEVVKLLYLRMERKASGADFVDAFRTAVGAERVKKEFANEFAKLNEAVGQASANKGDDITLKYVPNDGTRIRIGEAVDVTIPGQAFGKAIWETYLGKNPIDDDIKKNLMSQVK